MVLIVLWKRPLPSSHGHAPMPQHSRGNGAPAKHWLFIGLSYEPYTGTTENPRARSELDRRSDTGVSVLPLSARRLSHSADRGRMSVLGGIGAISSSGR